MRRCALWLDENSQPVRGKNKITRLFPPFFGTGRLHVFAPSSHQYIWNSAHIVIGQSSYLSCLCKTQSNPKLPTTTKTIVYIGTSHACALRTRTRLCRWNSRSPILLLGSLSNNDGNENGKYALFFWLTKQQLCTRITLFLYIYLPTLNDYEVKLSNYSFYEGRENKRKIFSFFF